MVNKGIDCSFYKHGFKRISQSRSFSNRRECVFISGNPLWRRLTSFAVIDYYDTIQDRRVVSNVSPGYLRKLLPSGPPEEGEKWESIQKDIESKIMPGLTHW